MTPNIINKAIDTANYKPVVVDASGNHFKTSWAVNGGSGVTDHGGLTGLANDDHSQYALLAGRSGGQSLIGGAAAGNNLTLSSTSHATKGKLLFGNSVYDEVNNRLGIGTSNPTEQLSVAGDAKISNVNINTTGNQTIYQTKDSNRSISFGATSPDGSFTGGAIGLWAKNATAAEKGGVEVFFNSGTSSVAPFKVSEITGTGAFNQKFKVNKDFTTIYNSLSGTIGVFTGSLRTNDTLMTPNIISKAVDTTNYKPVVVDANGNHFKTNWAGGVNYAVQTLTEDGSTITWNVANGINGEVTLEGTGRTLSITNPVAGHTYKLRIIQDGTGGRTITTWPTNTKWPNGTFPNLSSAGDRYDIVSFYYDGTNYYGTFQQNFQTGAIANVSINSFDTKTSGSTATVHSLTGVDAGALLVLTTTMNSSSILDCSVSSSPSLTWTKRADAGAIDSDNSEIWTAVYTGGGSITVTSNWGSNSQASVCYVVLDAESSLGGASGTATLQSAPSVTINTTRANSIIFGCTADWNAIDGTTRTLRDGATERLYFRNVDYTTYFYTKAAATTGAYTEGVSAPTGQQAATAILEIRGN